MLVAPFVLIVLFLFDTGDYMSSFREKSALFFSLYKYLIVIIGFPLEVLALCNIQMFFRL